MNQRERQRAILQILLRHRSQPFDLEMVRQEYGGYAGTQFVNDWRGLLDRHFVLGIGELRIDGNEVTKGQGQITSMGKEALNNPALWESSSGPGK